jgi:K+-sensing histidine kinase KdpD
MARKENSKIRKTAIIFGLLLLYIIAALVWWFISLERQNDNMRIYKLNHLQTIHSNSNAAHFYNAETAKIEDDYKRTQVKNVGEGSVFFVLMLLGAFYIYRSLRQQIQMQKQQQNFMMAVTHELKTPVAIASLNLETLLKHRLEEEKQIKLIKATLDETKRLDFLTSNILVSSQLENRGYQLNKEDLDFSALLRDRMREFADRFPDRKFCEKIEDDCEVRGDALLLQILINNLLENAVKYSSKGSTINVSVQKKNEIIRMSIADEGFVIATEEKNNIFKKFYRIGNESKRSTKGTGLGLYLCKKIAKDHKATIGVTDNKPKGSIFFVQFKNFV